MASWGLREDLAFSEQFDALTPVGTDWRELLFGPDCPLRADAGSGKILDTGPLWQIFIGPAPAWDVPRMQVLYTFDELTVYLHWIALAPP